MRHIFSIFSAIRRTDGLFKENIVTTNIHQNCHFPNGILILENIFYTSMHHQKETTIMENEQTSHAWKLKKKHHKMFQSRKHSKSASSAVALIYVSDEFAEFVLNIKKHLLILINNQKRRKPAKKAFSYFTIIVYILFHSTIYHFSIIMWKM